MKFIEPIYRPPMEADSLLLQVMQSCDWNKCNFCYRRKDYRIMIATPEALEEQLRRELPFYGPTPNIFLVGSDAFAIPYKRLCEYLEVIHRLAPGTRQISMFSRIDAISHKSDKELADLAKKGVTQLYVGTENGNDEILKLMNKGHTTAEALEQLKRLDKAGISYTVFYIFGLGGKGAGQQAAMDTAALFNAVHPKRIVSTGMTVTPGTGAAELEALGKYVQASEREKIEEMGTFLRNLKVDAFYDGIHMLNPLHFRFQNSDVRAKTQALAQIDEVLANYTDAELEQAIDRAAMAKASTPD